MSRDQFFSKRTSPTRQPQTNQKLKLETTRSTCNTTSLTAFLSPNNFQMTLRFIFLCRQDQPKLLSTILRCNQHSIEVQNIIKFVDCAPTYWLSSGRNGSWCTQQLPNSHEGTLTCFLADVKTAMVKFDARTAGTIRFCVSLKKARHVPLHERIFLFITCC